MNSQAYLDEKSQSLVVYSQLDETETKASVKLDYQAKFLKCSGVNANEVAEIASCVAHETSTQHELGSDSEHLNQMRKPLLRRL